MIDPPGVKYELANKVRGISYGGVGLMVKLAQEVGLVEAIDSRLHLLKMHVPYHESDHVLNLALNALCDATCLQDIELRRNDEVFLDALGAASIPDPTTAGDFCRRFTSTAHIDSLQEAIHAARLNVWKRQPLEFFEEAIIVSEAAKGEPLWRPEESHWPLWRMAVSGPQGRQRGGWVIRLKTV